MSGDGQREITYLEAVREAMVQEMRLDPEVFLIGEDIGVYGGALELARACWMNLGQSGFSKRRYPNTQLQVQQPARP